MRIKAVMARAMPMKIGPIFMPLSRRLVMRWWMGGLVGDDCGTVSGTGGWFE
jgi:hypothetical protein